MRVQQIYSCFDYFPYQQSKCLTKFIGTNVSVFAVHPGVVQTELGRHLGESSGACIDGSVQFFGRYFFKTSEMGAQTSIYCATEESLSELSGHYFR